MLEKLKSPGVIVISSGVLLIAVGLGIALESVAAPLIVSELGAILVGCVLAGWVDV